jgi:predicted dehydrogenase
VESLGIGLIGTGFMGRVHSLAYTALPIYNWPLRIMPKKVLVVDIVEELAVEGAARFGFERYSTDWRDAINDPNIGLIDIVVPNDFHAEIAIAAAKAGKHVICEKPLARDAEEAEEMVKAVEEAGVCNLVAYNYRRAPAVYEAKRLIDQGAIGNVYHFRGSYLQDFAIDPNLPLTWRFQKQHAGSGSLGDIGSHTLDMALFLVGDISSVMAMKRTFIEERPVMGATEPIVAGGQKPGSGGVEKGKVDIDDVTVSLLDFSNGATGSLEASRFAAGHKNHLVFEINGSKGSLIFDWHHPAELKFYSSSDPDNIQGYRTILTGPPHPFGEMLWPLSGFGIGYSETTVFMMSEFLNCISENKRSTSDFRVGLQNCRIMDAILKSAQLDSRVAVS